MIRADHTQPDFGLYVHWPFCQAKCPYCDFNSHVAASVDHDRWRNAYLSEIRRLSAETGPRTLRSIFFGGGTPSLMKPETVHAIIDAARMAWSWTNDVEITLEANPTSIEASRFRAFREAGVNRVSVGIQALDDADLKRLGRLHSAEEARAAFELAREIFPRASFDLIYARQHQTRKDWHRELRAALGMGADHLSLYQLTIEPNTAFGDRHSRGLLRGMPGDDHAADMYEITQDLCDAAGLPAYEISNHARAGGWSQHNLIYWRGGDYGGIGPGAHGRLTLDGERWATTTLLDPKSWIEGVELRGSGEDERNRMTRQEQGQEYLMMGLRLAEGLDLVRLEGLLTESLPHERLEYLQDLGVIELDDFSLRTTRAGRPLLNAIIRELLA